MGGIVYCASPGSDGPGEGGRPSGVAAPADASWEARLAELLAYRDAHGDVHVPRGWPDNPSLAIWVLNQRRFLRQGTLAAHRRRRLEESGVRWRDAAERAAIGDRTWDGMFRQLAQYRKRHGHCRVPRAEKGLEKLALWAATQRWLLSRGKLPADRRRRLQRLGMSAASRRHRVLGGRPASDRPDRRGENWNRMYAALREYRRLYGESHVLASERKYGRLATWVKYQRVLKKRGLLDSLKVAKLERIGFVWQGERLRLDRSDRTWERMFRALVRFKRLKGHCNVPRGWTGVRNLGVWVWRQRVLRKAGRLAPARVRQLQVLKFDWAGRESLARLRERSWDARFREVAEHVRVHAEWPSRSGRDASLARWVGRQTEAQRAGTLAPRRAKLLRDLGAAVLRAQRSTRGRLRV